MTTKTDSGYAENNGWLLARQQLQLQRRDHSVITFYKQNVIPAIRLSSLSPLSKSCKYSSDWWASCWTPLTCYGCLLLFPCSSTFAWVQHPPPSIVLCVAARGRSPLLFSASKCVREVFRAFMKALFILLFRPSPSTVFQRKSRLSCHEGGSLCRWEHFLHLVGKMRKKEHTCDKIAGLLSCLALFSHSKCERWFWLGPSAVGPERLSCSVLKHKSTVKYCSLNSHTHTQLYTSISLHYCR